MKRIFALTIIFALSQILFAQNSLPQLDKDFIKLVSYTNNTGLLANSTAAVGETTDCNSFTVNLEEQQLIFNWSDSNGIIIPDGPDGDWTGINFIYNPALAGPNLLPDDAYVWKVDAYYKINHTWVGDLEVKLFTTDPNDPNIITNSWMIRDNEGSNGINIDETRTNTEIFLGSPADPNWYFQVCDTSYYDTGTITDVQLTIHYKYGDEKPDLRPYQLLGWDDEIVISNVNDTTVSATEIYDDEIIYVDYSCINSGNVDAWEFKYGLYLDNVLVKYVEKDSLEMNNDSNVLDAVFQPLSEGPHTFKVVCDYDDEVTEIKESNNEHSKQFTVLTRVGRSINGYKFNDINANGIWDSNEPTLQGWRIFADLNNNYLFDINEPNDITDADGAYSLQDINPGTYIIAEVNQPDWQQTYPSDINPAGETLPQALSTPVIPGPATYGDQLSYSELADIQITSMDSPPKRSLVKWKKQIGKGKRFKSWKQAIKAVEKGLLDEPEVQSSSQAISDAGDIVLNGVPTSTWTYGCSATAAGMIFGYYDRHGYSNMYTGPTNGGVAPLTNLGQGAIPSLPIPGACSIIATQDSFDGRTTPGHVDDYWINYNEEGPDPWETSGIEHTWGDCTTDFMGTNQWKWAFNGSEIDFNVDGSTALFSDGANKLYDYIPPASAGSPRTALCHGMRLFAESRGYTVTENYTQHVDTYAAGGFSFDDYKNEIDNGYPVMIQVAGHSMVGVGYNDSTQEIIIHDTWENSQHRMDWGGSYESMLHQGVTVIHLEPASLLNNVHQVVLSADEDVNDINFGNNSIPGSISGYKFNDLDANGVWDENESGLQGWQIFVDLNQNYQFDADEPNDITDENGAYSITGLYPGTYTIAEVSQPDWQQSYPATAASALSQKGVRVIESVEITTTNSDSPIYIQGEVAQPVSGNTTGMMTQQSGSLINMDDFRNDSRFAGIDGSGYCVVIIDTGIDLDHPYFGPDSDSDGVADRIIFQYDFADGDFDASDQHGHGSNVSSIVGSQDSTNTGMAPGVNIIALKVFEDAGGGNFGYTEAALQWVINNATAYNIVSVNMSLGDVDDNGNSRNYNTSQALYGIHDELSQLATQGVIVVSASGNSFYYHDSQQGVSYPAADEFSLSIGAVYDSGTSGYSYESGAIAYTTAADRICPFSQRGDPNLTTIFAPGAPITGADDDNGTVTMHGTSQASPHIAGIAALAQQLAGELLGRQLGIDEFIQLIQNTAVTINDGDDEDDNVINTNLDFPRVDMMALAEAIYDLGAETSGVHQVTLGRAEDVNNVNFGNHSDSCGDWGYYEGDINGDCYVDYDDLALIASTWLDGGAGDIDTDTNTDFRDYAILANQWLLCTDPQGLDCDNLLE